MKALDAQPAHARSGLRAAQIHRRLKRHGHYRKTMAITAAKVSRGLPPEARAAAIHDGFKYYNADIHRAAFALPTYVKKGLAALETETE